MATDYDRAKVPPYNGNDPPPAPGNLKRSLFPTLLNETQNKRERKGYERGAARHFLQSFPLSGSPVVQSYWAWSPGALFRHFWGPCPGGALFGLFRGSWPEGPGRPVGGGADRNTRLSELERSWEVLSQHPFSDRSASFCSEGFNFGRPLKST